MATNAVVVVGQLPTSNGTYVDFTSTGFGTPDAAIVIVSNANTTNNPQPNSVFSVGFWTADGQNLVTISMDDALASTETWRKYQTGDVALQLSLPTETTADTLTEISASSPSIDGIRLTKDSGSSSVARYATVILIKGCLNEYVGLQSLGTGTDAIDVTAPGFRADLVFAICNGAGSDSGMGHAILSFGAAQINASGTVSQGLISFSSEDAVADTDVDTMVRDDAIACQNFNGALNWKASVGAHANGFTLTPNANASSDIICYLALELADPDDAYVAIKDTITGIGYKAYTGAGFTPEVLILGQTMCTAVNTNTQQGYLGIGAGGPATVQRSLGYIDEDAQADSDNECYADTSNIINIRSAVGTEDTVASLSSLDADGWTLNYSDGSASARKMLAIAIGNATASGTTVVPGAGGYTYAGQAPTISQPHTVAPAAGAVSVAGYAPSLAQGVSVAPGVGSVAYTGQSPVILQPHTVTPSAGAVTVLGYAPAIQQAAGIYPGAGEVVYAGQAPTIRQPHTVAPGVGAYDILGYAPTVSQAAGVAPLAGSIIILGYAPSIAQPHTVAPGAGAAAWLGYEPTISQIASSFTEAQLQEILAYVEANMAVPTTSEIAAAVWSYILEGALTAEQMQRIMLAALAGKRSGLGTATEQYMGLDGVTPRVTFTPTDEYANGTTIVDGT